MTPSPDVADASAAPAADPDLANGSREVEEVRGRTTGVSAVGPWSRGGDEGEGGRRGGQGTLPPLCCCTDAVEGGDVVGMGGFAAEDGREGFRGLFMPQSSN